MPSRQKLLLIGLVSAVLLWQGRNLIGQWVFEPLNVLRTKATELEQAVRDKSDQLLAIQRAKVKLRDWQARSFATDAAKSARPDAIEALRQYTAWVTELADDIGFEEVAVTPQRKTVSPKGVFVEVTVQVVGRGRFSQLAELLDRFYRTDVLHRVGRLQISSEDVVGDPPVQFTLDAQALALVDVPPQRTVFPRTTLAAELSATGEQLTVTSSAGFPKKAPFLIRLERELLLVTALSGDAWTVTRGVERTERAEHPAKSSLSLSPVSKSVPEVSRPDFQEFVRTNVFVKPTPPAEYDMKFGPFTPPVVVRGKSWEYSVGAKDFDPARGEPKYRLLGDLPDGLAVNELTGQVTWKPERDSPAGKYPVVVEVRHPSAPDGRLESELPLELAEPNSIPKFKPLAGQTIYRGQPWSLALEAVDADDPPQKLTYKLGSGAPPGAQLNAATGELTWTPGDDQALGPVSISISVVDNGTPPQTGTATLQAKVMEDAAKLTELVGIVEIGDEREAWFFDKTEKRKTIRRVGEELRVADVRLVIAEIAADHLQVKLGERTYRMKLGETIRGIAKFARLTRADSAETPR